MCVAIVIKITILQRFASNVFEKRNPKVTTVDFMHSDHGNDMHTHSDHGNEMQRIVNMCNDILCDENGSDIDMMLYVTMYLTLINLNRFSNRVCLTLCILLITCHLAVAYCLNTRNYFPKG